MKGVNEDEFDGLLAWCGDHGFDLCLIETMPMGDITGDRTDQYLPLSIVRSRLRRRWTLQETDYRTGGPARYFDVAETGRRVGFITPMTHNFCESCNRVRLTCTGTLYMCLGQDDQADLRVCCAVDDALRRDPEAISRKPKGHDFVIDRRHDRPAVARHMSVTGGSAGKRRTRAPMTVSGHRPRRGRRPPGGGRGAHVDRPRRSYGGGAGGTAASMPATADSARTTIPSTVPST